MVSAMRRQDYRLKIDAWQLQANSTGLRSDPLADIRFQNAKCLFVALDRHLQRSKKSLGGEKIEDDALAYL